MAAGAALPRHSDRPAARPLWTVLTSSRLRRFGLEEAAYLWRGLVIGVEREEPLQGGGRVGQALGALSQAEQQQRLGVGGFLGHDSTGDRGCLSRLVGAQQAIGEAQPDRAIGSALGQVAVDVSRLGVALLVLQRCGE